MRSSVSRNAGSSSSGTIGLTRPIASSAVQPKISAAPPFHERTRPSRSKSTIAVGEASISARWCSYAFWISSNCDGLLERGRRLVRERAQDLQPLGVRAQPVGRVVDPDVADAAAAAVRAAERTASRSATRTGRARRAASCSPRGAPGAPRAPPRAGSRSSRRRRTRAGAAARARRRTAATPMFSPSAKPTCATVRWKPSSESSCTATFSKPSASEIAAHTCAEQRRRVGRLVQRRRDGEQPLERVAVRLRARAFLRGLDGERRVLGDGDEDVDLVAARPAARDRLVDREDAEQLAVRPAHRHEQRVVRMPGVGSSETTRSGV